MTRPKPHEAGYTLAEMLAALMIVSLGFGGAFEAGKLLERQQRAAVETNRDLDAERAAERGLQALMAGHTPPRAGEGGLEGGPTAFHFLCGAGTCAARLSAARGAARLHLQGAASEVIALPGAAPLHFVYAGAGVEGETWPPAEGGASPLQAVLLVQGDGPRVRPLATARIWAAERGDCRFDPITRACARPAA